MIVACGIMAAVVGSWFMRHELAPVWGGVGPPADIHTSNAFGVREGQPLFVTGVSGGPEPMVVTRVIDSTHFVVARSRRGGWRVRRRWLW